MKIWIPGKFPNLNDYINAERRNKFMAAKMKRDWTGIVLANCLAYRKYVDIKEFPITVRFIIHEQNSRRDVDNITATVAKFCLDGMVAAGILPDDSQKYINKIESDVIVDGDVGVEIIIDE